MPITPIIKGRKVNVIATYEWDATTNDDVKV
jgi:hypothetical protein